MDLQARDLHLVMRSALDDSLSWAERKKNGTQVVSNSLRSSMFCTQIGRHLHRHVGNDVTKRQIVVTEDGKREAGEWLLDIVWTEDLDAASEILDHKMPWRIRCAVECESSTAWREFFKDFAKLLNVRSPTKIFLGGLNQKTPAAAMEYMNDRLMEAQKFIRIYEGANTDVNWFIGFWPSPTGTRYSSLWDKLGELRHLRIPYVYQYNKDHKEFRPYSSTNANAGA